MRLYDPGHILGARHRSAAAAATSAQPTIFLEMRRARLALLGILSFLAPAAGAAVVIGGFDDPGAFDPLDEQGPNISQIYPDFPGFDSIVVDDYSFSAEQLRITNVSALIRGEAGFASFDDVLGYQVSVFSSLAEAGQSVIGDIASVILPLGGNVTVTSFATEFHALVELELEIELPEAGTYWVGVAPVAISQTGNFRMHNSPSPDPGSPGNAQFANPGLGFGTGGALTLIGADLALGITAVPEPSACMLLALGGAALWRRRRSG